MSASAASLPQSAPEQSNQQIKQACAAIVSALGDRKYAIVGDAACQILGSLRVIGDIDIVVPKGQVATTRRLLAAHSNKFIVEPRTLYTHFDCSPPIRIDILSPPITFTEKFNQDTSTVTARLEEGFSVFVLHPKLILNAKCRSILVRPNEERRAADASDIKFLLEYLADKGDFPTSQDVPNASKEFITFFFEKYGDADLSVKVRHDLGKVLSSGAKRST